MRRKKKRSSKLQQELRTLRDTVRFRALTVQREREKAMVAEARLDELRRAFDVKRDQQPLVCWNEALHEAVRKNRV